MNSRLIVVNILLQVIQDGRNLPDAIANYSEQIPEIDRGFIQAISYGVIRFYPRLQFILDQLISKPLKNKDQDVVILILSGLYQLIEMRIPDHAAVSETVKVTKALKKPWAKNLVNAVLRQYQRDADSLEKKIAADEVAKFAHPAWWINLIKQSWPDHWQHILQANNQNPPMTLRLNTGHISREKYLDLLSQNEIVATLGKHSPDAIYLEKPVQVNQLPLFEEGWVSVQDEAAQLAAILLDPHKDNRILDACAAPGGKTIHILERQNEIDLVALDIEKIRLQKIQENLDRCHLHAKLVAANAFKPETWWDKQPFDRILLDAPCSASGVIRRHPDIKLLRQENDLAKLILDQQQILAALWPLLKSGGMLLYATCSVLPQENTLQIERFLQENADAELQPIPDSIGNSWLLPQRSGQTTGSQILPGEDGMDGFFYARIFKR